MSSIRRDYVDEAKITYMSTRAFQLDFFTYTLAFNNSTSRYEGSLGAVSGATSGNCPKNRFLHETGKKLIPGENPGIRTMLVGVYDPVTFLKGYIDPNSEAFVRMNNDRAADVEALVTADVQNTLGSINGIFAINPLTGLSDYGQPVYTRGDVIAEGSATITGNITSLTGNVSATIGNVTAGNNMVAASNITATAGNITATAGNITATAGGLFIPTRTGAFDFTGATDTGAFYKKYIGPFSFSLAGATVLTQLTGINTIYNIVSVEEVGTTTSNYFRVVTPNAGVGINNCSYSYVIINA